MTKVETYPEINEDTLAIDLKGHTIEELAIMANVSVDVIKSAIKLRQQQMKIEKKVKGSKIFIEDNKETTTTVHTTQPWISSSSTATTTDSTTQSTTLKTTYIPKKKIKKHPLHNGHKANI